MHLPGGQGAASATLSGISVSGIRNVGGCRLSCRLATAEACPGPVVFRHGQRVPLTRKQTHSHTRKLICEHSCCFILVLVKEGTTGLRGSGIKVDLI